MVSSLRSLCREASAHGGNIHVAFTADSMPSAVDPNVSLCLYRIVQEALQNISRHSHARDAAVSVVYDAGHIALRISDSGVGFDPRHVRHAGLGLVSMRERVAALKGQLAIDASPGKGTQITVRIPLAAEAPASSALETT
jgi:signal transduction histidine kinase